jgi:hypothetical protein
VDKLFGWLAKFKEKIVLRAGPQINYQTKFNTVFFCLSQKRTNFIYSFTKLCPKTSSTNKVCYKGCMRPAGLTLAMSELYRRPSLFADLVFAVEELVPKLAIRGPFRRLFVVFEEILVKIQHKLTPNIKYSVASLFAVLVLAVYFQNVTPAKASIMKPVQYQFSPVKFVFFFFTQTLDCFRLNFPTYLQKEKILQKKC